MGRFLMIGVIIAAAIFLYCQGVSLQIGKDFEVEFGR